MTPACRSLCFSLSVLAACGGGADSSGDRATAPLEPTVRDSAGVTIYEHPADALERAPLVAIDSVPLAVFAGDVDDPEQDVSTISWLSFTSSGDLVGYEREDHQFTVLLATNGARMRYGRAGAGPGELGSNIYPLIVVAGDTVLMGDSRNDRIAVAHPDTGIVRTISRSAIAGMRPMRLVGRLGDSLYLLDEFSMFGSNRPESGILKSPLTLATWQAGDDSVRKQHETTTGPMVVEVHGTTGGYSATGYNLALAPSTQIGRWGDGFLVGSGESWQLEQWTPNGQLSALLRIAAPPRLATDSLARAYAEAATRQMVRYYPERDRDSMLAAMLARPHADTVAAYGTINVTPNGTIWVLDYQYPDDTTWAATAIAPDGRILGRIPTQVGKPPQAWGDDRVAFKTEDDLGIATITIRALHLPH